MIQKMLTIMMVFSFNVSVFSTYIQRALYVKENRRLFNVKIVMDFLTHPAAFFAIALVDCSSLTAFTSNFTVYYCIFYSIFYLVLFTCQFVLWGRTYFTYELKGILFTIILADFLFGLILSMSTINYAIYCAYPAFYELPAELTMLERAFEFIYYTFTLAVTYSSNSISAVHIVTKLIQIIEICYFYIIVGNVVVKIVNERKPKPPAKPKTGNRTKDTIL